MRNFRRMSNQRNSNEREKALFHAARRAVEDFRRDGNAHGFPELFKHFIGKPTLSLAEYGHSDLCLSNDEYGALKKAYQEKNLLDHARSAVKDFRRDGYARGFPELREYLLGRTGYSLAGPGLPDLELTESEFLAMGVAYEALPPRGHPSDFEWSETNEEE